MGNETINVIAANLVGDSLSVLFAGWTWLGVLWKTMAITPSILGTSSMALLTIFIPLAIASFNDNKQGEDFYILDRYISLHDIFQGYTLRIPRIVFYVAIVFLPLILWSLSPIFMLCIWGVGTALITKTIKNIYDWMNEDNKYEERFAFLKKEKPSADVRKYWWSVWQVSNINRDHETEFFKIFTFVIDTLAKNKTRKNMQVVIGLLADFRSCLDNRPPEFFVNEDVLPVMLRWNGMFIDMNMGKEKIYYPPIKVYGEKGIILDFAPIGVILRKTMDVAFINPSLTRTFFSHFKNHTEQVEDNSIEIRIISESLFKGIERFFEMNQKKGNWEIYECFPNKFKITRRNLNDSVVARALCNYYRAWAGIRIENAEQKRSDPILYAISKLLFPKVNMAIWAYLLNLVFTPQNGVDFDLKLVLEKQLPFADSAPPDTKDRKTTLDLFLLLFMNFLHAELNELVKQARALKGTYPPLNDANRRIELFIDYLEEMQEMLRESPDSPKA